MVYLQNSFDIQTEIFLMYSPNYLNQSNIGAKFVSTRKISDIKKETFFI